MNKDKQIDEIKKVLIKTHKRTRSPREDDMQDRYAEALYNAGYCKSSYVAREIFEEIEKITMHNVTSSYGIWLMSMGEVAFAELKKKYTGEGK